ncbi:uncharacterized protein LOC124456954 [Xenia sp. Carnegie-2017]|uniref:uncharacterized protein LOC124456954 n=1 Tax=Xenia sp. Carnegie-2017 TaxID=2897299 RepID=UPI001F0360EE|nr:uncharacterized protein LOC124456954 [Xenia sp. Carnegie-2017]
MSPGVEVDQNMILLTTTTNSQNDLERLCRLDVLGLEATPEKNPLLVYDQFREDLPRDDEGWYETGLPWKTYHPELPSYERGSLRRLNSLMKRLERSGMCEEYNAIIKEQLQKGVVEIAPTKASKREFYIPHKPVVKKAAEPTKLRIVYDASAKESATQPSLNDCSTLDLRYKIIYGMC